MTTIESNTESEILLQVDVEVRGKTERITWREGRMIGDERLLARLDQTSADLSDPAGFLVAVRSCFGDAVDIRTNVAGNGADDGFGHT